MAFFNVRPMACKRAIARRRWLHAALAFRCCVNVNCALICSAYFREQRPPRAHKGASFAVAVRTWQRVRSGFFPPMPQAELTEKDMAQAAQDQVSLDRKKLTDLEVIHPQFRLAVLEGPFDDPSGKRHTQERFH